MARIDFEAVNGEALSALPSLLWRWLPDGRTEGQEYVARNPRRFDRKPGSFKINLSSGKWCDFATGDAGGDVVSFAAYLSGTGQAEAITKRLQQCGFRRDRTLTHVTVHAQAAGNGGS